MASSAEVLRGRLALVTGGSRGIGRAVAARLADAGADVVLAARSAAALEAAAAEIGARAIAADVAEEAGVRRIADELGAAPDIVVHAAGAFELATLEATSIESFDRQMAVNTRAAFLLMRTFVPGMRARGAGHFVAIGSIAGRQAFPANGAYAASKFALRAMLAVLHAELRGSGVHATLVEPAATDTELWSAIDRSVHTGLPERSAMLDPEAVASAVMFALSQPRDVAIQNVIMERA